MTEAHSPTLSIVIPCLNEKKHLPICLDSLLAGDFPQSEWEILVVDGGSTDGTLDVIADYQAKYPFVRLISNPAKLKPIALNIGIREAQGEIVMRIDAHASYAPDYVSRCVDGLRLHGVDNIGGVRETHVERADGALALALSLAISDPVAVGNAHYRTGSGGDRRLVDTVFCGCYRKQVFEKIGMFNEKLIRTQDREFNYRLRDAGGSILLDPAIRCTYYSRTTLRRYLSWNWEAAFWLGYARRFTTVQMLSLRNLAPPMLVVYLLGLLAMFVLVATVLRDAPTAWLLGGLMCLPLVAYVVLMLRTGARLASQHRRRWLVLAFPLVVAATHLSYGVALIWGVLRSMTEGRDLSSQRAGQCLS